MPHRLIDLTAELRDAVRARVAGGFATPGEVCDSAIELFCDDADEATLVPLAERLTAEAFAEQCRAQIHWPAVTDCDRLDAAFARLDRQGVVARHDYSCCGTCGVCEIGDELDSTPGARGYAFYHQQDTESAVAGRGLYLNFGAAAPGELAAVAVGHEVVAALAEAGLGAKWNGRPGTRIFVALDWKRRRTC